MEAHKHVIDMVVSASFACEVPRSAADGMAGELHGAITELSGHVARGTAPLAVNPPSSAFTVSEERRGDEGGPQSLLAGSCRGHFARAWSLSKIRVSITSVNMAVVYMYINNFNCNCPIHVNVCLFQKTFSLTAAAAAAALSCLPV